MSNNNNKPDRGTLTGYFIVLALLTYAGYRAITHPDFSVPMTLIVVAIVAVIVLAGHGLLPRTRRPQRR